MRPYTIVGELLLSDGTTYTRIATYDAPNIETALRRAATLVGRWRSERIVGHFDAMVRDVVECRSAKTPPRHDGDQMVRRMSRKASSAKRSHHDSRASRAARSASVGSRSGEAPFRPVCIVIPFL